MCLKWTADKPKFSTALKRTSFNSPSKIVKTAKGYFQRISRVTRITAQRQLQRQLHRIRQCLKSANRPEEQHPRCNLRRQLQPRESAGKVTSDREVSATPYRAQKQRRVAHNSRSSSLRCNNSTNRPPQAINNRHSRSHKCSRSRSQRPSSHSLDVIFAFSSKILPMKQPTKLDNPTLTQTATIGSPAWRAPSCRIFSARLTLSDNREERNINEHKILLQIRLEDTRLIWAISAGT